MRRLVVVGVHSLRTAEEAAAIRAALDAGARTVVIGAGFIGSEVASAARKRGLPVTIVEALDVPLTRSVGPEVGAACAELHRAAGTDLRLSTGVDEIESSDGRVTGVRLSDTTRLPAELVVLGIGSHRPPAGWRAAASRCTSGIAGWSATRRCGPACPASMPPAVSAGDAGLVALYRRGDRIVGAATVDRPQHIMKFRRRIASRGDWAEALAFAGGTDTVAA